MNEIYRKIIKKAESYLDTRHNDLHTDVCFRFALKLLQKEGGDHTIVIPAVALHDVGWKAVPEDMQIRGYGPKTIDPNVRRIHEVEGCKIARHILEEAGYDEGKIAEICEIVLYHDSREKGVSLEDCIVKDADKLYRLSHTALRLEPLRHSMSASNYLHYLRQRINIWYLTHHAKEMAKEELLQREFELAVGAI